MSLCSRVVRVSPAVFSARRYDYFSMLFHVVRVCDWVIVRLHFYHEELV